MSTSRGAASVRLFVALDLPDAVREELARWGAEQLKGVPGVRRVPADSMHVTLCFLGSHDRANVHEIATACQVAGEWAPLALSVGSPLWLPRGRPRVLAVGLRDGREGGERGERGDELARLQAAVAAQLVGDGWYESERRPFMAHVTVARFARPGLTEPPPLEGPRPQRFSARAVSLYRSHLGPPGARYEPLATLDLRG